MLEVLLLFIRNAVMLTEREILPLSHCLIAGQPGGCRSNHRTPGRHTTSSRWVKLTMSDCSRAPLAGPETQLAAPSVSHPSLLSSPDHRVSLVRERQRNQICAAGKTISWLTFETARQPSLMAAFFLLQLFFKAEENKKRSPTRLGHHFREYIRYPWAFFISHWWIIQGDLPTTEWDRGAGVLVPHQLNK